MNEHEKTAYMATLKKASLTPEAKLRMREELAAFADLHAVRMEGNERSIGEMQSISVFALFTNYSTARIMKATLLIALMVGLGGGTSLAAQNTVPGDLLYPVKVHVNENVQSAFAFDANAKANLELALLQERMEEAKRLSDEGLLQGSLEVEMQTRIASQVDEAVAAANSADAEVGADIRVAVSDALSAFSNRLALVESSGNTRMGVEMSQAASAKADSDDAMMMSISAFGTSELAGDISVQSIIEQAQTRLEALQATLAGAVALGAEVQAEFKAQLQTAAEFIAKAQADMKAGAEVQAEQSVQQAHEIMGEVESALSLMGEVKIDMNTGHIIGIDLYTDGSVGGGTIGNSGAGIESEGAVEVLIDPVPAVMPEGL